MCEHPSITAAALASQLGGTLEGDGTRAIRAVATLEQGGPDTLSWVGTPDVLPRLAESNAGVVLIPTGCPVPPGRTVILVDDPDLALCKALGILAPPLHPVPGGVHPTAVISPDARIEGAAIGAHVFVGSHVVIGTGSQLCPGTYVGAHVRIGSHCLLWPNVVIREHVTIGDRVVIHPNSTIGADGFSYIERGGRHHKIPQIGTVVIEDDVEIGANSAVDRARSGQTRIGRGTKIDNMVQIGHNVDIGEDCIIVAQCGIAGSVVLGHHVMLGGKVGIIDHLHIGHNTHVAAASIIMRNIPDGKVMRGSPATEKHRFLREQASLRKLPQTLVELRALKRKLQQLEDNLRETTA